MCGVLWTLEHKNAFLKINMSKKYTTQSYTLSFKRRKENAIQKISTFYSYYRGNVYRT